MRFRFVSDQSALKFLRYLRKDGQHRNLEGTLPGLHCDVVRKRGTGQLQIMEIMLDYLEIFYGFKK